VTIPGAYRFDVEEPNPRSFSLIESLRRELESVYRRVIRHRERYLKAWIAATGLHPLECEIVEEHFSDLADGKVGVRVYCRRRSR